MENPNVVLALATGAVGFTRLLGATRQAPSDLRGPCGVVLGRNDTLQGDPTRLLPRVERPPGTWAWQIVEPEARSQHRVFS